MSAENRRLRGLGLARKYSTQALELALAFAKSTKDHDEQVAIQWALKTKEKAREHEDTPR